MAKQRKGVKIPTLQEQIYLSMNEEDKKHFRTFSELQAVTVAVFNDLSEDGKKKAMDIVEISRRERNRATLKKEVNGEDK